MFGVGGDLTLDSSLGLELMVRCVVEEDTVSKEPAVLGADDTTLRIEPLGVAAEVARVGERSRGRSEGKLHISLLHHGPATDDFPVLREAQAVPVAQSRSVEVEGGEVGDGTHDVVRLVVLNSFDVAIDIVVVGEEAAARGDCAVGWVDRLLEKPLAFGEGVGIHIPADHLPRVPLFTAAEHNNSIGLCGLVEIELGNGHLGV